MPDNISREELKAEIRALRNEWRLGLVTALVVLKFDVPDPVTVTAVLGIGLKAAYAATFGRGS